MPLLFNHKGYNLHTMTTIQNTSLIHSKHGGWLRDVFLLTLIISVVYGFMLGDRPLGTPDEARYSEIPREMVESGDYITPRLNYLKYFYKPPLLYWTQAASIKAFGLSDWSLRLSNALMALLGALAVYIASRKLYDRRTAWIASLVLATSLLYFVMGHLVTTDLILSTMLTISLLLFLLGIQPEYGKQLKRWLLWGAYIFAALAVLSKGLVGIVLPILIVGLWILILNRWRLLLQMCLISGIILFLLVALPWHILVQWANPEFFDFYIIDQHFTRYATLAAKRYQPVWFFLPFVTLGMFPWVLFMFQAMKNAWPNNWQNRQAKANEIFLLLWALSVFIFFSLSKSKLIPYILPVFPPMAILIGHYLSQQWHKACKGITYGFYALPVIYGLLIITVLVFPFVANILELQATIINALMAASLLLAALIIALYCFKRYGVSKAIISLFISTSLLFMVISASMKHIDGQSIKSLTTIIKPTLQEDDIVVAFGHYYQDLPFYLERKVYVVDGFGELRFGMAQEPNPYWMINADKFWSLWDSEQQVFAIAKTHRYEDMMEQYPHRTFYELGRTNRNHLISNKEFVQ